MSWKIKARLRMRSFTKMELNGRKLTPTHKTIALEFADGVNDDGIGYPTIHQVTRHTEYSYESVKRIRKDLIAIGLIVVLQPSKGPGHATLISINPEVLPLLGESGLYTGQSDPLSKNGPESVTAEGSQEADSERGSDCPPSVDNLSTETGKGVRLGERGSPMTPERGSPMTPHPSTNKTSSRGGARERAQGAHALPAKTPGNSALVYREWRDALELRAVAECGKSVIEARALSDLDLKCLVEDAA